MPLTGGPADKAGNSYERRWTVNAFLDLLDGRADSIRIEVPGEEGVGAEFQVMAGGVPAWHQAKRQRDAGPWTIANMDSEGVLAPWWPKIQAGGQIVFVSSTGAQELNELVERASDAESWSEFKAEFLTGTQSVRFQRLRSAWGDPTAEAVYEALKSVKVELIGEPKLTELVEARLASLVTGGPATAAAVLGQLADDSVHQRLTATEIWDLLQENDISPRNLSTDAEVSTRLSQSVDRFLGRLRRIYIGGRELPRGEASEAFDRLVEGGRVLIAGAAGMGKSVVAGQVVELAGKAGWTVLVLSADRMPGADTVEALAAALGLPGSPPTVLAGVAGGGDSLLVIDQLDAVSVASGRHSERLAVIEDLLADAAAHPRLHVLLACRQFDLDHDRHLRAVAAENGTTVASVRPFDHATVAGALAAAGVSTSLPAGLADLLAVPQHLAIYVDLATSTTTDTLDRVRSLTDLYDRYWRVKQQACRARRGGADEWVNAIDRLVDRMSDSQTLAIPTAATDDLADQVGAMASENVLFVDDQVVSFFHETFFDYCYARRFVARGQELRNLLLSGEQDLWRRAQVRQVLTYERATAFDRYLSDFGWLLSSADVRMHVKALVVATVQTIIDPRSEEWAILAPIAANTADPLCERLLRALRRNPAWFPALHAVGAWSEWLNYEDTSVVDRALWLLSGMTREHGDEIADLLHTLPQDELWPDRIRRFTFGADLSTSRQLIAEVLDAVGSGHFDGPQRDDLWFTIRRLVDGRPEWAIEVVAALIDRALAKGADNPFDGPNSIANARDQMAGDTIRAAAQAAPRAFVEHLLGHLLEVAKRNTQLDWGGPDVLLDSVWWYRIYASRSSLADHVFDGMDGALRTLARTEPEVAERAFEQLRTDPHESAWFLLARGYAANPVRFARPAADWLANTPGALHLGYSNSPHWVSREMIAAISPVCSDDQFDRLVDTLISYTTPYERTYEGLKLRGLGELCLLNAIEPDRRPARAERRLAELRRKFLQDDVPPPSGFRGGIVPPPIPIERARKMTDDQWLRAMARHEASGPRFDNRGNFVGDASTQAEVLAEQTQEDPERFAQLLLRMPDDVAAPYVGAVLRGLKGAHLDPALLLAVCLYAEQIAGVGSSQYIAELIRSEAAMTLSNELLDVIESLATDRPDSTPSNDQADVDAECDAARSAAALAIGDLVSQHPDRLGRFREALEGLATDRAASVRQTTIAALAPILYIDAAMALDLFRRAVSGAEEEFFASHYTERFLNYAIRRGHYAELADIIERMIASGVTKVRLAGVRQLTVAAYQDPELDRLVDDAAADDAMRAAVVKLMADNVISPNRRDRAFEVQRRAFDDPAAAVRSAAITCFYGLENEQLSDYSPLFEAFLNSRSMDDDSSTALHVLASARQPLPPVALDICEITIDRHGQALGDITSASGAVGRYVSQLAVRLHAQHADPEMRRRCLDLIDHLVTTGAEGIDDDLAKIER